MDIIEEIKLSIERFGPVMEQSIPWYPHTWIRSKKLREEILELQTHCNIEGNKSSISREQVVSFGETPEKLFIASMVFGYGDRGYGAWRVARIRGLVSRDEFTKAIECQFAAAALSPADSWNSHTSSKRLKFFGPAFATKFAYFAALRQRTEFPIPLIADVNTSKAVEEYFGISQSAQRGESYLQYVDKAREIATEIGGNTRPDDVERSLFTLGKEI
jgi:hypothetical protein